MSISPRTFEREQTRESLKQALAKSNHPASAEELEEIFYNSYKSKELYQKAVRNFIEQVSCNISHHQETTDGQTKNNTGGRSQDLSALERLVYGNQGRAAVNSLLNPVISIRSSVNSTIQQAMSENPGTSQQLMRNEHRQPQHSTVSTQPAPSYLNMPGPSHQPMHIQQQGPQPVMPQSHLTSGHPNSSGYISVSSGEVSVASNATGAVASSLRQGSFENQGLHQYHQSQTVHDASQLQPAQSLLMLGNHLPSQSQREIVNCAEASCQMQNIPEPYHGTGPAIGVPVLHRADKNLFAVWSPPDFSSYNFQGTVEDELIKNIRYHVVIYGKGERKEEFITNQCFCLIKCANPFDEYQIDVTWSVHGLNIFTSIPKVSSEKRSVYKKLKHWPIVFFDELKPICRRSAVYEGYYTNYHAGNKHKCAVKFIEKQDDKRLEFLHKKSLRHVNIAHYIGCARLSTSEIAIATELCQSLTLQDVILEKKLSESDRRIALMQVMHGLKFLHDNRIVHGNLKPDKILFSLSGKHVKLSYFGLVDNKAISMDKLANESGDIVAGYEYDISCALLLFIFTITHEPFQIKLHEREIIDFDEIMITMTGRVCEDHWFLSLLTSIDRTDIDGGLHASASIANLLKHPFFWGDERRIDFMNSCIEFFREYINEAEGNEIHKKITKMLEHLTSEKFSTFLGNTSRFSDFKDLLLAFFSSEHSSETQKLTRFLLDEDEETFLKVYSRLRKIYQKLAENHEFPDKIESFYTDIPPYEYIQGTRKRRHCDSSQSTS